VRHCCLGSPPLAGVSTLHHLLGSTAYISCIINNHQLILFLATIRCNKCGLRYKHGRLTNAPAPLSLSPSGQSAAPPLATSHPTSKSAAGGVSSSMRISRLQPQSVLSPQTSMAQPDSSANKPIQSSILTSPQLSDLNNNPDGWVAFPTSSTSGSISDAELPVKRPCSRTSRDAAMALMELNW